VAIIATILFGERGYPACQGTTAKHQTHGNKNIHHYYSHIDPLTIAANIKKGGPEGRL
jgi:hypothetical protein